MLRLWMTLMSLTVVYGSPCEAGSDLFAAVAENSPMGQLIVDTNLSAEPGSDGLYLCLEGPNAHWMFLDGPTIRLNTSESRVLDREVQGPLLTAQLICYDNIVQKHYRIQIQVLNENDNKPEFLQESTKAITINELTAVNTVVFSVKAMDADGDTCKYTIDSAGSDSSYFRIDRPNSGHVILDKPLDYETKTSLKLLIWATEVDTAEKFSSSTDVMISVQDGDDQYPHFLPCVPLMPDLPVCTSPSYSTNITEKQKDIVLEFSPGPIKAVDADRGVDTPLHYSIISGSDHGRFIINSSTGLITLTRAAGDRRQTPFFRLSVMASQLDDPLKYSIASVLVRVLVHNMFPPVFNQSTYRGFVVQSASPAAIVSTYGNQVLLIQVSDQDFPDGVNPNVQYSLYCPSVTERMYHITQGGVLIASTHQLQAFERHIIQVIARDEESGEQASASVDIEVLQRGQAVPRGAVTEEHFSGDFESHLTGLISVAVLLVLLSSALLLCLRLLQKKHNRQEVEGEAKVRKSPTQVTDRPTLSAGPSASSSLHGYHGLYTRKQSMPPLCTSAQATNESSDAIVFSVRERSEGSIDPLTLSPRASADRTPEERSTLEYSRATVDRTPEECSTLEYSRASADRTPEERSTLEYSRTRVDRTPEECSTLEYSRATVDRTPGECSTLEYSRARVDRTPEECSTLEYSRATVDRIPEERSTLGYFKAIADRTPEVPIHPT